MITSQISIIWVRHLVRRSKRKEGLVEDGWLGGWIGGGGCSLFPSELGRALRVLDRGWRRGRWGTLASAKNQAFVTMSFQVHCTSNVIVIAVK